MFGETWATLLAAFAIGTIAVARTTRFVAEDEFPPIAAIRDAWIRRFNSGGWSALAVCAFCISPYIAAADLAWAILTDLQPAWWIVNGWAAAAYLAAILVSRDLPADARE